MPVDKDTLREFYIHVFPADLIYKWLSYGSMRTFENREVSYSAGEFYRRFLSFSSADALRQELVRVIPEKVDYGAIFSVPCSKKALTNLEAQQRELIFDIDATDYDNVRFCCSEKDICVNCWTFMSTAVHVLSDIIENDLGYSKYFWVYSGRRGIHCWVCDEGARKLKDSDRNALVGYISVYEGAMRGTHIRTNCDSELKRKKWVHPTLRRIIKAHLAPALNKIYLNEFNTNCIWTNEKARTAIQKYLKEILPADKCKRIMDAFLIRGNQYEAIQKVAESIDAVWALENFLLAFLYPRLDRNVSKAQNHLLKSPFVIHPGTGRLCVALDEQSVDSFDPIEDPPVVKDIVEGVHKGKPLDLSKWYKPLERVIQV